MSSGPIIAMVLARDNAISHWKDLMGPGNSVIAKKTHPDRSIFTYLYAEYYNCIIYIYLLVEALVLVKGRYVVFI